MKKISLVFCLAFLSHFVAADENTTQILSTNMVGITSITSSLANFPLAVTYGAYTNQNFSVCITNSLCTSTLEAGDQLKIYNSEFDMYEAYLLGDDKKWSGVPDAEMEITPDPEKDAVLSYGSGIWLIRKNLSERADKRIIMYGQIPAGDVTVVLPAKQQTLISFPISESLDLNDTSLVDWTEIGPERDMIFYYDENGSSMIFSWNSKQNKWKPFISGTSSVIPRGMGFYYKRNGTSAATLTWHLGNL